MKASELLATRTPRAARDVTLVDTVRAPSSRCYWLPLSSPPFSLEQSSAAAGRNPSKRGHSPHQPRALNNLPAHGESPSPAPPCRCKLPRQCLMGKKRCYQPNESPYPILERFYLLLGSTTPPHPPLFPLEGKAFSESSLSLQIPAPCCGAASCAFQAQSSFPNRPAFWQSPHCTACPSQPRLPTTLSIPPSLQQGPLGR